MAFEAMPAINDASRRGFLRGVGLGVGGLAAVGTVSARGGPPSTAPSITFPDQDALVLPENPAPMEAAVQTQDVFMPDGGWVVISKGAFSKGDFTNVVGQSIHKLPAGHFQNLKVATAALSREQTLTATIVKGENLGGAKPYEDDGEDVSDDAAVTYPS